MDNIQALNSLVDEINGTTSFLSRLISRKAGYAILIAVSAAIALKLVL